MNFKINHIKIENFRCIESLETDLWNNTIVQGANESGKSTFASAILWVLTGKNVENQSTFEIVPNGKIGQVSPCVELECMIGDRPATLKREYKAKFTRDKKFADYAVTTYINGVETGVRKFQEWVSQNICNEQVFKILSNPKTFTEDCPKETKELVWQAQRRLLLSIIGNQKTDSELSESDNRWDILCEPLKRYDNANQYLAFLKKQYADTQKSLNDFDVRIEQQEKNLLKVEYTEQEIEENLDKLKNYVKMLSEQNNHYKLQQVTGESQRINLEIQRLFQEKDSLLKQYNEDMQVFEKTKTAYQQEAENYKNQCAEGMKQMKVYAEALEKLEKTTVKEICETCGQRLNPAAVQNSKRKLDERIQNGRKKTAELRDKIAALKQKSEEYNSYALSIMEPTYPAQAHEIQARIDSLYEKLTQIPEPKDMDGFPKNMESCSKKMEELKEKFLNLKRNKEVEQEIEKLESERKDIVQKVSEIQEKLDTVRQFISFKCESAEKEINSMFENVRFQLFEKNKSNDEIKETCILKYRGIKYDDLSYSTKIIAGLEVVKAFQKFYNVTVPVLIDNAESITETLKIDSQCFLMYVKDEHCPKCGGESGRKTEHGAWLCKQCNHEWKKKLEIMEG